ncbi:gluconate 2-dehydrogenase subunit 3 family protein [Sphingobacterium tabacisoli]|uniref:Gluconate 2-dehydrogenase subunit 3 family protein n=1 Tax=Sphingobacterium tabacisoli TaxID=2044855 RepID=A0ABW5L388_9SPHI|nr:gluconate 2-dehydrogenase subunit 3 family protein [Sphingobacterium tabacisoli]
MNRRGFIYRLAIISPLLAFKLGCTASKSEWELISGFVKDVRNVILPSGDNITMEELSLERFVLTMLQDCFSPDEQQRFFEGRGALDRYCDKHYKRIFEDLNSENKLAIISRLNAKDKEMDKETLFLFGKIKAKIIQGFQQSELMMKDRKRYELVPGRYNGYYKIA